MRPLLFLIGMPGAGKTVWGKMLARHYHWQHIDLDHVIEEQAGKPIAAIFEADGEPVFRQQERKALQHIISTVHDPVIVSCGGGTPLFFDNLEQMKSNGCVIYLDAATDTLISHLQDDTKPRPLLVKGNLAVRLGSLLAEREEKYRQAHYIFNVESLTEATFAEIFAACTNRH
jgi:shikimate kinase